VLQAAILLRVVGALWPGTPTPLTVLAFVAWAAAMGAGHCATATGSCARAWTDGRA